MAKTPHLQPRGPGVYQNLCLGKLCAPMCLGPIVAGLLVRYERVEGDERGEDMSRAGVGTGEMGVMGVGHRETGGVRGGPKQQDTGR